MRGIIIFSLMLLICGSLGDNITDEKSVRKGKVSASLNKFAADLYQEIAENEKGNFVFAPISVSIVLSMLASGSRGDTKNQLLDVLFSGNRKRNVHKAISPLLREFNNLTGVDLKLANNFFLSNTVTLNPEFNEKAKLSFNASAENVDFSDNNAVSELINKWSEEQTNSKITNVITPDDINVNTVMVLLNAVFFKGTWADKFFESDTRDMEFHLEDGTTKLVPTMFRLGEYRYAHLKKFNARFIELPYENKNVSMFIIVPDESSGLKDLERNISTIKPQNLLRINTKQVQLYLPKFKVESSFDLKSPLEKLGVTDVFTQAADFQDLTSSSDVVVSNFLQKAFIEVNEEGSEAAAITEVGIQARSGFGPVFFKVNKPFLLLIATEHSILFMARIVDP